MAQVLKEEQRTLIVNSAVNEFLAKGYRNTTMRNIARNSKMTVGNLYRYFKSKEDILMFIVSPVLNRLNSVLKSLTSNSVSMETRVFAIEPDVNQLEKILDELADQLVDIYKEHKLEFKLVLMHSDLSKKLIEWFSDIIYSIIDQKYNKGAYYSDKKIVSHSFAVSIASGLTDIVAASDDNTDLNKLFKIYFRSYMSILDNDIKRFVG
ncbi:MAG: TetR/AcrR family transcriptional regulator [Erysipelotrichaceae bacterium]|nr:TetR/AcrR family transcriptional regulator [Erysipelotrichaceae bacterium]